VLEWRFGAQLDWRLVTIGLRDEVTPGYAAAYDPERAAGRLAFFHDRYGMPFALQPKERASATGTGCRAIVAARLRSPGSEWRVLRALQLAYFNSGLLLDDPDGILGVLREIPGLDADAVVGALEDPDVAEAYAQDRAEARTAAGTPAEAQAKTSTSDGPVRFTAPSVVFELDGTRFVAGGWQPALAYDVLLANLDPSLGRTPPPESPEPLLERFPDGLTTAEVGALLATGPDLVPDLDAARRALEESGARRAPLGQDALWTR
jgi:hypothetical protein